MPKEKISPRDPSTKEALVIFALVLGIIVLCINITLELIPALVLGAVVASLGAKYLNFSWDEISDGMIKSINNGLGAVIIMVVIGMIIGTWILCGAIPILITFGLKILTPSIFLPAGFLLCLIVSVFVGTSLGTIATMGVVLMGVGEGLGIPQEMTGAVVVCGAIFGDKISPMSDSTNVAAAVSGTPLFSNIKSLTFISIPAALISLVLYYFLGRSIVVGETDMTLVEEIIMVLENNFNITPFALIPVVIVVILLAIKTPAVPTLVISFITASITAMLIQGASLEDVLIAAGSGFQGNIEHDLINGLLSQGGVVSMQSTIVTILVASAMGGILEKIQVLNVLLLSIMNIVKKPYQLILTTLMGGLLMMLATGEMVVSMILVGRTLQPAYDKMGIHRSVLSRSVEISCPLFAVIIPWGVVTVYSQKVLNIGLGYIKYSYLPFLALAISVIFALFNLFTFKADENNYEASLDATKTIKKY